MASAQTRETARIEAPLEFVFERLVDHEAMNDWPGVRSAKLLVEGKPTRNGLGAVREIRARGLRLHEEIVHFEPPIRYDYAIIKGLPVEHLGTVRLEADGDAVDLTWDVTMKSGWPFVSRIIIGMLARELPVVLAHFKRDTERRYARR